jgi:hypothetical protein
LSEGILDRYDTATLVRRVLDAKPLDLTLDPNALQAHANDVETIIGYMESLPKIAWPLVEPGAGIPGRGHDDILMRGRPGGVPGIW